MRRIILFEQFVTQSTVDYYPLCIIMSRDECVSLLAITQRFDIFDLKETRFENTGNIFQKMYSHFFSMAPTLGKSAQRWNTYSSNMLVVTYWTYKPVGFPHVFSTCNTPSSLTIVQHDRVDNVCVLVCWCRPFPFNTHWYVFIVDVLHNVYNFTLTLIFW